MKRLMSNSSLMDEIRSHAKCDLIIIRGHGYVKNGEYMDLRLPHKIRIAVADQFSQECEYNKLGDFWVYGLLTSKKSNLAILQIAKRGFSEPDMGLRDAGYLFLEWWKQEHPGQTNIVFIKG